VTTLPWLTKHDGGLADAVVQNTEPNTITRSTTELDRLTQAGWQTRQSVASQQLTKSRHRQVWNTHDTKDIYLQKLLVLLQKLATTAVNCLMYPGVSTTTKLVLCGTDGWLLLTDFQSFMTFTFTFDLVMRYTVVHQSSTSIYIPNFVEIGKILLCTH